MLGKVGWILSFLLLAFALSICLLPNSSGFIPSKIFLDCKAAIADASFKMPHPRFQQRMEAWRERRANHFQGRGFRGRGFGSRFDSGAEQELPEKMEQTSLGSKSLDDQTKGTTSSTTSQFCRG